MIEREQREKYAYDEGNVLETSEMWHSRFRHVFQSPNTLRNEKLFDDIIWHGVQGRRVLEIGSGDGITAAHLLSLGAAYVYGIDISESMVTKSKQLEKPGRLEFGCMSVSEPISGKFGLIVGRSILHHIDYREALSRMYRDNLKVEGLMIFMEPLGSNFLLRLYWLMAKKAHTYDERPLYRADLQWLKQNFTRVEFYPINLFSFLFGIISSKCLSRSDNLLLRICDRIDVWLAKHIQFVVPHFRQVIIVVRKGAIRERLEDAKEKDTLLKKRL
jgi:2-polyprenyl-3-methyl-5-hydroxy-6-metoxy-1,4-benzoquinol methylase